MDRLIPQKELQSKKRRVALRVLAGILLLAGAVWALRALVRPAIGLSEVQIATVVRSNLQATLDASGLIRPEYEDLISCPRDSKLLKLHVRAGGELARGDTIMQLETKTIHFELSRIADQIALKKAQLRKQHADQQQSLEELQNQLAILAERIRFLEAKRKQEQELYEKRLTTVWSFRQAERDEKIAQLEYRGMQDRISRSGESAAAGQDVTKIELHLLEQDNSELQDELKAASLLAPRNCILSWVQEEEGADLPKGAPLARLANRDSWKVEGSISDVHTAKVQLGQLCYVRVNQGRIQAVVQRILPQIEAGKIRFDLKLDQPRNPELHSNLRVNLELVLDERWNVLTLKRGPGVRGASVSQEVFVVQEGFLEKRRLRIGLSNRDSVEILDGLQAGESVVVSNMKSWLHLDRIKLK